MKKTIVSARKSHDFSSFSEVNLIAAEMREKFKQEGTGHDWWHFFRVWQLAKTITANELARHPDLNGLVIELASIMHDIADWKFHENHEEKGTVEATDLMARHGVPHDVIARVLEIINTISFKGAGDDSSMSTLEGEIVQDADRLDALGAIGVARAFAYGGYKKRPLYDPDIPPEVHATFREYKANQTTTINHFYEKLLLLPGLMNTETAKVIAQERLAFVKRFLKQFLAEWEGRS